MNTLNFVDKDIKPANGFAILFLAIVGVLGSVALFINGIISIVNSEEIISADGMEYIATYKSPLGVAMIVSAVIILILSIFLFAGLKIVKPNDAYVFTLFGKYYGTLKKEGFHFVNPFVSAVSPTPKDENAPVISTSTTPNTGANINFNVTLNKKVSMKAITLNNRVQKVNDSLGNPIEIGVMVVWQIVDASQALFCVDNYKEFISIQSDAVLRNTVRLYPYDINQEDNDETTLRGSSIEVAEELKKELQKKVEFAGLKVLEIRITHLAYAKEIAASMLQRQQARAVIDARKLIVEGAVGMVQMALEQLEQENLVELDEERKAAMVSNLLVVLCANKDTQPVVNSGSIY